MPDPNAEIQLDSDTPPLGPHSNRSQEKVPAVGLILSSIPSRVMRPLNHPTGPSGSWNTSFSVVLMSYDAMGEVDVSKVFTNELLIEAGVGE